MEDNILNTIKSPDDIKKLNYDEKMQLSQEIRDFLINSISKTGGHLASNLGVVELTIALLNAFNPSNDKIVWDVGHQSYVYKILTGRKEKFKTLRKKDGLSGFPKREESIYDIVNTGHSSTSISIASGIARSRDIKNENHDVVAIIGDGSLTGGMALEALNDVGSSDLNLKIILNDNEMSISKNVGGIPLLLSKLRSRKSYTNTNAKVKKILLKIPIIGKYIVLVIKKIKRMIKSMFIKNMYFEDIGYTYFGPIDGHNIKKLETVFEQSKRIKGPVLIHVITTKGKGYSFAEDKPNKYHAVSEFDILTGKALKNKVKDYSTVFGDKLTNLAKEHKEIVTITASMKEGCGLTTFASIYPNRFFDVGIAEEHAIGLASGLALSGLKPYIPIYSSFLQRSYDQLIHDVCLSDLPVTICVDRSGIVGNDGETHQGIYDLSYLNTIPNMTIFAPSDFHELEEILEFSVNFNHPLTIRYPKGSEGEEKIIKHRTITLGKGELLFEGKDITIIAIGKMVDAAISVRNLLLKENIYCEVINIRFLNPIDEELILESIKKTKKCVTIEDNIIEGGLASKVTKIINKENLNIKVNALGYPKKFIKQGNIKEIEKEYNLDSLSIKERIKENLNERNS